MIPLFSLQAAPPPIPSSPPPPMVTASHTPSLFLTTTTPPPTILPRIQSRFLHFPIRSLPHNNPSPNSISSNNHQPRTVFPGGFKRPQLKLPCIVLCLYPDDVLSSPDSLDFIDTALSMSVGIVVLHAGPHASGNRLYQAACLLKSVVRDRAFLLIGERVDIAAAVNATGVLLSDQGLPTIVARNMMMDSKPDSVLLPLVGRNVQSPKTALTAAKSEGADFLIYNPNGGDGHFDDLLKHSGFENVKIPIFTIYDSNEDATSYTVASKLLTLGCSGFVMSLGDLRLFTDSSLNQLFNAVPALEKQSQNELQNSSNIQLLDAEEKRVAGFLKLKEKEKNLIETERSLLLEAISFIQKAVPMMEEVSLLIDAVSQIDEPFLLAIVGEFNSGKSSVINALLGKKYLKEGVVPTTNEITFLRYSKYDAEEQQRCERHPDGQFICYLPAPILKGMNIVDTPGTNVILQRQQRLTEEFVPRADLLLFVISADRPLTESEVSFLRYTQQWKKKVVFVLNKSDLYQNSSELEEAISFIKENTRTLLNAENVTLYPVSARSALEAKLSASSEIGNEHEELKVSESHWKNSRFCELEKFLYSFLDGATRAGRERMKLKLETPIAIAERLLSSCETLVKQDIEYAEQDLISATKIVDGVKGYAMKMENESISWRRRTLSLIDTTKSRVVELVKSTLQLSNLDLVASYIFRGGNSATMPATIRIQNDIMGPALSDAQKLIGEYVLWVQSNTTRQGKLYKESFEKQWPTFINPQSHMLLETYELLKRDDDLSLRVINDFSASATSKLFEQEIREVFLGTFGGLGAAGLSASLLTSVLPTTLEDLLALGLCSTGGYVAILNFPARRQKVIDKVNRIADGLAREVEEAMQKDLLETVENLEKFVTTIGKPYQDAARQRLDKLVNVQEELSTIGTKIRTLQVEIQNLHVS